MGKHAEGPWKVLQAPAGCCYVKIGVHELASVGMIYGNTPQEALANALLVVAAPDMLAMLQAILDEAFGGGEWQRDVESFIAEGSGLLSINFSPAELATIRGIIAKATGGSDDQ